jgi:uncharacterized protein YndB with AHSA1/START domain
MNDEKAEERANGVALEYELDDAPQKVWRAISVPELRESWLPDEALVDREPSIAVPGEEARYRMRDSAPPFLESVVTFRVAPNGTGGTILRIIHELAEADESHDRLAPANSNGGLMMCAA